MNDEKEKLQEEIERARIELDNALKAGIDDEWVYECSVTLDKLIEKYIEKSFEYQ